MCTHFGQLWIGELLEFVTTIRLLVKCKPIRLLFILIYSRSRTYRVLDRGGGVGSAVDVGGGRAARGEVVVVGGEEEEAPEQEGRESKSRRREERKTVAE
ncbi:methyl-CpG-binding domain-containing protein 4-like [Iris pallida]|uniref:Methyl-CpG-binding domain-containing protein 4-like n=1 Tax=Iris pallida TaxID=29817 RepID=A0AAX6DZ59_IRIPA|nr:methyl-CpG-binding domain-containing protein 4-like [Iris pallida]